MIQGFAESGRMQVFRRLPPLDQRRPCALTIGNFDGVHQGHRALLKTLGASARGLGLPVCVLTFDPHPREFFAARLTGPSAPTRIATLRDKLGTLAAEGVDRTCVVHFNERFAALSPQDFIDRILVEGLQVRHLLIGDDFRFGARRAGDVAQLRIAGESAGFTVQQMSTVALDGERISSSAVRAALAAADFARVERLLGRPYVISGHVVHGRKLGRTLGFPTLNLRLPHGRPALGGVFVVEVDGLGPTPRPGVASLGTRPAVETHGVPLLETHLLDGPADAYGRIIRVRFLRKLRDEAHYDSLEALTAQIQRDASDARAHFGAPSFPSAAP